MDAFEREEEEIIRQAEDGEISQAECSRQLNELYRDYRAAAEEAAREAYDNEMNRW